MRHHQKRFLWFFIVVFILSLLAVFYFVQQFSQPRNVFSWLTPKVMAQEQTEEYIDDFQAELKINQDNSVNVAETIVYNFGDMQRHGIYRDLPYRYFARGGKFTVKVEVLGVTDANNQPVNYQLKKQDGNIQIKIGDENVLVSGRVTYKISYRLNRVINFFNDHDELYWNVTGNNWPVAIDRAGIVVKLPPGILASTLQTDCYTGLSGSTEQNCQVTNITNSQVGYSSFNTLLANEGLTVVLGWPKGILTAPSFFQQVGWVLKDNPLILLPLLVLVIMMLLWYFHGRDLGTKKTVIPFYEAPANLLPVEVGTLIDERVNLRDISSTFIHLAVRGYLKIKKLTGNDWELFKLKDFSGLELWEKEFAQEVFGSAKQVKLSELKNRFYKYLPKLKREVYDSLVLKKFFPVSPGKVRAHYLVFGALLFAVGLGVLPFFNGGFNIGALILSAILIILIGQVMPRKTEAGSNTVTEIKGYQLYLGVAEKSRLDFHNAPQKTPAVFEQHLPYAMALGVEKKWAGQFANIYVTPPSWYDGNFTAFNTIALVSSLNSFDSHSRSVITSQPGAASGHSGFSGGSSGGGFGGGGGGSW
ncbi:MAG: DUF2207 domain-containing protein [Candidatus Komeilibacteria bacterium]|nr:DUF2207 domain-containing protein [Candidatus Komeilibacteria bacterium]